jgi:DNA-binding MarR family transcriptional regulator
MLKIKDNVDLILKLDISNKKEKQEELEEYTKNLIELYEEMLEALNEERNYIHYRWLSDLPDVAKKLKFKVYQILPDETFGGHIEITKKGIKKITKEMIKYNLVEKVKEQE